MYFLICENDCKFTLNLSSNLSGNRIIVSDMSPNKMLTITNIKFMPIIMLEMIIVPVVTQNPITNA
jgi:hypothetical protein